MAGQLGGIYCRGLGGDALPIAGGHIEQLPAALLPCVNVIDVRSM